MAHSTNYFNAFIEVAEDTQAQCGSKPPTKGKATLAEMQYNMLASNPYRYTSDDIFFQVFADRSGLSKEQYPQSRKQFFSKGQPCFRASPLTKTYGFGIHSDSNGKVALYGMETSEYQAFLNDTQVKKMKAMKSKR